MIYNSSVEEKTLDNQFLDFFLAACFEIESIKVSGHSVFIAFRYEFLRINSPVEKWKDLSSNPYFSCFAFKFVYTPLKFSIKKSFANTFLSTTSSGNLSDLFTIIYIQYVFFNAFSYRSNWDKIKYFCCVCILFYLIKCPNNNRNSYYKPYERYFIISYRKML